MYEMTKTIVLNLLSYHGDHQDTRVHHEQPRGLGSGLGLTETDITNAVHLTYLENNCFGNIVTNKKSFESLAGKKLSAACGAVGLCSPTPTWWEWGGTLMGSDAVLTAKNLLTCPLTGKKNCHFWLEDADGLVYDVVPLYLMQFVARVQKKTICTDEMYCECIINGVRKSRLKECGLWYKRAPINEEQKKSYESLVKNFNFDSL